MLKIPRESAKVSFQNKSLQQHGHCNLQLNKKNY